jgi:hypothetical protein
MVAWRCLQRRERGKQIKRGVYAEESSSHERPIGAIQYGDWRVRAWMRMWAPRWSERRKRRPHTVQG